MSVSLQKTTYKRLVKDIAALYDHVRNTVVETYRKIGKRIVVKGSPEIPGLKVIFQSKE